MAIDLAIVDARPADAGADGRRCSRSRAATGRRPSLAAALASIPAYWLIGRRYRRRRAGREASARARRLARARVRGWRREPGAGVGFGARRQDQQRVDPGDLVRRAASSASTTVGSIPKVAVSSGLNRP